MLIEFHGQAEVAGKRVYAEGGGVFRSVTVEGAPGVWVTGEHAITIAAPAGGEPLELRVTGNVLLWQRGDVTLRLETALGLEAALEVARSAG